MTDVLKKRGHLDTDMHMEVLPNEDGVRNWYDTAKIQGKQRCQKTTRSKEGGIEQIPPLSPQEETTLPMF